MESALPWLYVFALVWGAIWGSFLNVVVWRVPRGESVIRPGSRCPACHRPIRAWENIPLVSFLLLRARCAGCKATISARYPIVEGVVGALAIAVAARWIPRFALGMLAPEVAAAGFCLEFALVFGLAAIALIDAETFIVPDGISLPLVLGGLAIAPIFGLSRGVDWQHSLVGALVGGGGLWLLQQVYARLTRREGLGTGDVKLLAAIGAWLGASSLPFVLLVSSLAGLTYTMGLFLITRGEAVREGGALRLRHLAIPFGPFLVVGALAWLLFHNHLDPFVHAFIGGDWP